MTAWQSYASPVGELLLAADEEGLTGLWLAGEKYFPGAPEGAPQETPVLEETKRWLDIYFAGREPDFLPPLHLAGSPFRQEVWALLRQIPYGETTTSRRPSGLRKNNECNQLLGSQNDMATSDLDPDVQILGGTVEEEKSEAKRS